MTDLDLQDQYIKLNKEIAELNKALRPMRRSLSLLQSEYLVMNGIDDQNSLIQMQKESERLDKQLQEYKNVFSDASVGKLSGEVEGLKDEIYSLILFSEEMDTDISEITRNIEDFKNSQTYEVSRQQKEYIRSLVEQVNESVRTHKALKAEIGDIESIQPNTETEKTFIQHRYERKLQTLRKEYYNLCELSIAQRNKQMKEIKAIKDSMEVNSPFVYTLCLRFRQPQPLGTFVW